MTETRVPVLSTASAAIAVALSLVPAVAGAATITPNILTDELDATNTNCSLREAISIANADSSAAEPDCAIVDGLGDDAISLGAGDYVLDISGSGDNNNATGDLDVNPSGTAGDLTIDGAGAATTTIDADDGTPLNDRVLHQVAGASPLVVSDLTITGGAPAGSSGGGILMLSGDLTVQSAHVTGNTGTAGGGINAASTASSLAIADSTVEGNTSNNPLGGGGVFTAIETTIESSVISDNDATSGGAVGGGIRAVLTSGTLTVTDSVIADNTAESTNTGPPLGGGIRMTNGSGTIRSTTISGNEVLGGDVRLGGGVHVSGTANLKVVNSTLSGNEALLAGGSGGGLVVGQASTDVTLAQTTFGPNPVGASPSAINSSGILAIRGSVIETSGAFDACAASAPSQGFNVFTDSSCGTLTTGDEADADPLLGPLQDNGGPDAGAPGFLVPIPTHAPAAASTVVDHVPAADCDDELGAPLLVDQRGLLRPQDGDDAGAVADCEAGSIEVSATPTTPPPTATPPAQQPPAKKKCKKGRKLKKGKCVKKKKRKKK